MHTPYGLEIVERCTGCRREEAHAFCKLPEPSLRALEALKYMTLYPRGALLFVEGQATRGVYLLCSGRVKLSATARDARVIITRVARAGEILGLCATLSGGPYEVTAETLEPSQVTFVRADDFTRFLATNAEASLRATEQLARNYSAALEQVRLLGLSHSAAAKLARFLLEAGGATDANAGGHADRLRLALTHEEIGQFIGASRETVTRLFSEFKHENLIQVTGAVLQLNNRPALEALANY
jgi:CRP/FNR family cyclic AMP-dependent transcriptional regulator